MNPSGASSEQDVAHPALVEERPDRAEDLFEVLARASLVDPHSASSMRRLRLARPAARIRWFGPAAPILGPSLARPEDGDGRECNDGPGGQQGDDDRGRIGIERAGDSCPQRSGPADRGRTAREQDAWRTPAIHHVSGLIRPKTWSGSGRTDEREDRPDDEEQGARPRPRGRTTISWRVWRQTAAITTAEGDDRDDAEDEHDDQQRPVDGRRGRTARRGRSRRPPG